MPVVCVIPWKTVWHKLARRQVAKVKEDNREEPGEAKKRRCRSASTWTPPRKRSISPQGPIRCKSLHICRSAATGGCRLQFIDPNASRTGGAAVSRSRSMTPEDRERGHRLQVRGCPDGRGCRTWRESG